MSTQTYQYAPLDTNKRQIRVVCLLPGKWEIPISCELQLISLDSSPEYETLSYVWGTKKISILAETILLHGHKFPVTTNLYRALRRLRRANDIRVIWIDALCINQDDLQERSAQVQLMGRIYRDCREVMIWIDDYEIKSESSKTHMRWKNKSPHDEIKADRRTVEGMQADLSSFLAAGSFTTQDLQAFDPKNKDLLAAFVIIHLLATNQHFPALPCFSEADKYGEIDASAHFKGGFKALGDICVATYWQRIWVVQELILPQAATMIMGSYSLPWKAFAMARANSRRHQNGCCNRITGAWSMFLRRRLSEFAECLYSICSTHALWRQGGEMSILTTLREYCGRRATNPRDKVYGILGLIDQSTDRTAIIPDYLQEINTIFEETTLAIIKTMNNLEVLTGTSQRTPSLSWVARWDNTPQTGELSFDVIRSKSYRFYSAAKQNPVFAEPLPNSQLRVHGSRFDTVAAISRVMAFPVDFLTSAQVFALAGKPDVSSAGPYRGMEKWQDAYWRTLCADMFKGDDEKEEMEGEEKGRRDELSELRRITRAEDRKALEAWRVVDEHLRGNSIGGRGEKPYSRLEMLACFSIIDAATHRVFFVTETGYLGLGPEETKVKDQVYVLNGSNVPFVLRPAKDEKECFRLVGDCYVHGIMDGEACPGEEGREAEAIVLV